MKIYITLEDKGPNEKANQGEYVFKLDFNVARDCTKFRAKILMMDSNNFNIARIRLSLNY